MKDLPIQILIFIGWVTATLPVKSPLKAIRNYQFIPASLSTLFVAAALVYMVTNVTDVLHVIGFKFFVNSELNSQSAGSRSAETIISAIMWFTQHSTIHINRLNFTCYCSLLVQILKSLSEAESAILKIKKHLSIPGSRRVGGRIHWILFALMVFIMTWNAVLFTTTFQKFYTDDIMRHLWTMPNNKFVNSLNGIFIDMSTVGQYCFVAGTFVAVGIRITNGILDGSYVLEMLCKISNFQNGKSVSDKEYDMTNVVNELQEAMKQLRFCYKSVEKVFGLPVLVLTFNMTLNVVAFLYGSEYDGPIFAVTGVTSALLVIFIFAHLGYDMEQWLAAAKDALTESSILSERSAYEGVALEKVCHTQLGKNVTTLAKWMRNLKWKMTARGVYPINHEMIPVLLSMGLTYIVFIFQLRAS